MKQRAAASDIRSSCVNTLHFNHKTCEICATFHNKTKLIKSSESKCYVISESCEMRAHFYQYVLFQERDAFDGRTNES